MELPDCMVSLCFMRFLPQGAVFQSVCNVLHFHQQWMRVSISKCACRHLLLSVFLLSQSSECRVVSHFGFSLQFPSDGFPWWLSGKESTWNAGDGEDPLEKKWQPFPVFLFGKSHGQRSLADCSPWDCEELGRTACTHVSYIRIHK